MPQSVSKTRKTFLLASACAAAIAFAQRASAEDPTGGEIIYGDGTITYGDQTVTITQASQRALITWDSFSVSSGSSVSFLQPNSGAIALNRVLGASPSHIDGSVFANGQVWIINSNGVLFGKGANINVGGLIATTADMRNEDFESGNYQFSITSGNASAAVINQGTIRTARGGTAILAGSVVSNEGLIQADMGNVVLASGSTFSVDFNGDNLIRFAVEGAVKNQPTDPSGHPAVALVSNSGVIQANGGRVQMTARAASNIVDNVVNNSGMIQATSVSEKNGEVVLDAGDGTVVDSGVIDVSGTQGGSVTLQGSNIEVADGARIDASGRTGGGIVTIGAGQDGAGAQNVTIGHATIKADATERGNGGSVVIQAAQKLTFNGTVSARGGAEGGDGGHIQTRAGDVALGNDVKIDTSAPSGRTGTWEIGADHITVVYGGGDTTGSRIDPRLLAEALGTTNVLLEASNGIDVLSALNYGSANTLGLLTQGGIDVFAGIQNSGSGALALVAGWDGSTTDLSRLGDAGVYGNNGGSITIGSDLSAGGVAVGSFGGPTLLAASDITLNASTGYAQIGFHGAGGGGIGVFASGDLTLAGGASDYATIGNGAPDGEGNATGDILVHVAGTTALDNAQHTWIGNRAGQGARESGNVTLVSGDIGGDEGATSALMHMIVADLGTSSDTGGNVIFGLTNGTLSLNDPLLYSSPHALAFLSMGDIDVLTRIQNSGSGGIGLVAGWDGATLDSGQFGQQGIFGNNGGSVVLDARNGDVSVGTAGGLLVIAADDVTLSATNGYAQLGYHGAGGGDIALFARGDLTLTGGNTAAYYAQLGNGLMQSGDEGGGNVTGNILAAVAGTTRFENSRGLAWLGNTSSNGDASGNVTLATGALEGDGRALSRMFIADLGTSNATGGDVSLGFTGEGGFTLDFAMVYSSPHAFSLGSTGDLTIEAMIQNAGAGAVNLFALGDVTIGGEGANGSVAVGSRYGTTTVVGDDVLVLADNGSAQIGYRGNGQGDVAVHAAGDVTLSASNGTAIIGNGGSETGGTVSVDAGGDVSLNGEGGDARIGNSGAGTVLVSANDIALDASAGNSALIGDRTVGGDVSVTARGTLSLGSEGQTIIGFLTGNGIHGNVNIAAHSFSGDISPSLVNDLHGGDFTMNVADASDLIIDRDVIYDGSNNLWLSTGGDIVFASSVQNAGHGDIVIHAGGDLTIGGDGAEDGVSVGSAYGTTALSAHDIRLLAVNGYAQAGFHGAGSGDISLDAGNAILLSGGNGQDEYAQIGNGGARVSGGQSGDIDIVAGGALTLQGGSGDEAYAQIGNGGAQTNRNSEGYSLSGDLNIAAASLTMTGGSGDAAYVQIGHGGYKSGANLEGGTATIDGDIAIAVLGDVTLTGGARDAYAQIGNGGSHVNADASPGSQGFIGGNVSVLSSLGGEVVLRGGTGNAAYTQIGNGGYAFNAPNGSKPAQFVVQGNVSVSDLSVYGGSGSSAYAQIGNGDATGVGFGDVSGDISIATSGEIVVGGGSGLAAVALIGNDTGSGIASGAISGYVDITNEENNGVVASGDDKKGAEMIVISGAAQAVTRGNRPLANRLAALRAKLQTSPMADLAGDAKSAEGHKPSDSVATRIVDSLGGAAPAINRVVAGGMVRELPTSAARTPHGVPSADDTYSSWGNDTLWQ